MPTRESASDSCARKPKPDRSVGSNTACSFHSFHALMKKRFGSAPMATGTATLRR